MVTKYWTWPEFWASLYPLPVITTSASRARSLPRFNASRGPSHSGKASSRRKLNPALGDLSTSNPIFQHFLQDKIGDFERSVAITTGVSVATAPWLTSLRFSSPQGFLAAGLVVAVISAPLIGYVNTMDQYSDLAAFAASGEIHGHKVFGYTHN